MSQSDLVKELKKSNKRLKQIKLKFLEAKNNSNKISEIKIKVTRIEVEYNQKNALSLLKFNTKYKNYKKKISSYDNLNNSRIIEILERQMSYEKKSIEILREEIKKKDLSQKQERQTQKTLKSREKDLRNRQILKEKKLKKVEAFKKSSGGLSNAVTSKVSTWTVRKK